MDRLPSATLVLVNVLIEDGAHLIEASVLRVVLKDESISGRITVHLV